MSAGEKCGQHNDGRKRKCLACGKARPPRRRAPHLAALDVPYEDYIALNGGEVCAICGNGPTDRRLDRDHDHHTGKPRGLLCHRCNRQLPSWLTPEWLRAAASYLERPAP